MKRKVLIIDDDEVLCNSIKTILNLVGYEAQGALKSTEGFRLLDEFNPEILLLDLHLKDDISGIDILKIVRPKKPDLKIVVLTGFGDEGGIKDICLNLGATKFLNKPLSAAQLKKELEGV